jgi:hypothetical protein
VREPVLRLLEALALTALVLAGHALGGGRADWPSVVVLPLGAAVVTALARRLPRRGLGGDVALVVVAQAAGHLALATDAAGSGPSAGLARMLAGHLASTVVVVALLRCGREAWSAAGRILARVVPVWRALLAPTPVRTPAHLRQRRRDDRLPAGPMRATLGRRGPPQRSAALA